MEHGRKNGYQIIDSEVVTVMSIYDGKLQRFGKDKNLTGTMEEAKESYWWGKPGYVITITSCIRSYIITDGEA